MRFRAEARSDSYDAVVVGAGLGGLTAAALLAKAGLAVLLVERHDRPGGYAHGFRRGALHFDSAVHLVGGCGRSASGAPGLVDGLLRAVGTREACDFVAAEPFYTTRFPDLSLRVASGVEGFVRAHAERFPVEERGIRAFVDLCLALRRETRRPADVRHAADLVALRRRQRALLRFHRSTLGEVLRAEIGDPRLAAALATLWPYAGLPPSRVSFVYFATMLASYLEEGAWYCRGTFQRLAGALVSGLTSMGGELLLRSVVRRILVDAGRVRGVVLENGQRIEARLVVSGADARQTFEELVGRDALETRFLDRLASRRRSVSALVVYAAGSLDPREAGLGHENFLWSGFDHDAHVAAAAEGRPDWLTVTVPTLLDPSLAPRGTHEYVLTTLLPHDAVPSWRESKEACAESLLLRADASIPGLRASLSFLEAGSPRTLERYTRNDRGAIYGWEHAPTDVGLGRLGPRTPVRGLFLTGHWTRPGGGVYGVVTSGIETAVTVTGLPAEQLLAPAKR